MNKLFLKKILPYSQKNVKYIASLPKVYLICKWAGWGTLELPFVKLNKDNIPLVYHYNDHNGAADQFELIPIDYVTTGYIFDWTFSKYSADKMVELLREDQKKEDGKFSKTIKEITKKTLKKKVNKDVD